MEITQTEHRHERKIFKTEVSKWDLWDNIKRCNILILGTPEGEERKGQKVYLKK